MKTWFQLNLAWPFKANAKIGQFLAAAAVVFLTIGWASPVTASPDAVFKNEPTPRPHLLNPAEQGKFLKEEIVYDDPQRPPTWDTFSEIMRRQREREKMEGFSYMISGTLILLGAEVGYRDSQDDVQKFAYSFSQSLAIGAIGYGYFTYALGTPVNDVYEMLDSTPGLTLQQKEQMLRIYLKRHYERRQTERWIRIFSHSLIAAMNISRAGQTHDPELKNALYVLGGLNVVAAISIAF